MDIGNMAVLAFDLATLAVWLFAIYAVDVRCAVATHKECGIIGDRPRFQENVVVECPPELRQVKR